MTNTTTTRPKFIVRGAVNSALILCTDGDFHPECMCGPGGWCAKVYMTRAGAERTNPGCTVEEVR